MLINSVLSNRINFSGSLARAATIIDDTGNYRKATEEELLASYDRAVEMLANQKKLAIIADSTLKNNETAKKLLSQMSPNDGVISVATDLFVAESSRGMVNNPIPLSKPNLHYFSNSSAENDSILELTGDTKETKDKIINWLETLPKAHDGNGGGVKPEQIQDIASVKLEYDKLARHLLHQKEIAKKLDDFMFSNQDVQNLIKNLPDSFKIVVEDNINYDIETDDDFRETIKLDNCKLFLTDEDDDDLYETFEDIENPDGSINEKGIIEWLNKLNDSYCLQYDEDESDNDDTDELPKQAIGITTDGREVDVVVMPDGTILSEAEFHFPHTPSMSMVGDFEIHKGCYEDINAINTEQKSSNTDKIESKSAEAEEEDDEEDFEEEYEDDYDEEQYNQYA